MSARKLLSTAIGIAAIAASTTSFAKGDDEYKDYVKSLPSSHQALLNAYENYFEANLEHLRTLSTSPAFMSDPTGLLDMMNGSTITHLMNSASSACFRMWYRLEQWISSADCSRRAFCIHSGECPREQTAIPEPKSRYFLPVSSQIQEPSPFENDIGKRP